MVYSNCQVDLEHLGASLDSHGVMETLVNDEAKNKAFTAEDAEDRAEAAENSSRFTDSGPGALRLAVPVAIAAPRA